MQSEIPVNSYSLFVMLICNAKSGCRKMHNPEFQFDHSEAKNKGSLFMG